MSYIGREQEAGFAVEAVRGTAESSPSKWLRNVTAGFTRSAEHATDDASGGVLENSHGRRVTQKWYEGSIEGILHADTIGYPLKNIYGAVSTSEVVAGTVYNHTFSVAQNITHDTLSVFVKDGDARQVVVNGCVVNSQSISAEINDYVRGTTELIGRDEASDSSTPSYDKEYDFVAKDIEVKIADAEGDLSGATATKVKNLSVDYDLSAIRDHVFGDYTPDNVYNSGITIEGSMELNDTDDTFKDLFEGDGSKYMQIAIIGSQDLGDGNNPSLTFLFHNIQVTGWERSGGNDELVEATVDFQAFYNRADGKQSEVDLQNTTASY